MKKQYHIQINLDFWRFQFPEWDNLSEEQQIKRRNIFMKSILEELSDGKNIITPEQGKYITINEIESPSQFIISETPRYFSHILYDHWKPKNRLYDEIKKMLKQEQHTILPSKLAASAYFEKLKFKTKELCEKHPKCKPVIPYWSLDRFNTEDLIICYWPNIVHMALIREKADPPITDH